MTYIQSLLCRLSIAVVLILELAIAPQATAVQQTLKQTLPPPPPNNPGSSAAGGRRSASTCPQDAIAATTDPLLTALSPTTTPGLSLAEHPTFLVYVPSTSAENAEFSLRSRDGRGIYRTTVPLTDTPTLISISLPDQVAPLEIGSLYTWSFAIICNPDNRIEDQFVTGSIQRIELNPVRLSQIEQSPPARRIALYQEDGIWYDALTLLFELKRSQPDDLSIDTTWREFLQSGGIDSTIDSNLDQ
ncbi:DUF928 domain-containing protein [Leptolyngbya sp. FACHB-671]|uniref:DUF928 domain-containing protein n=1 Tax=Leptolyngbya sp. FACHB-671 TaxID=2692812 RepID=UPI001683F7A5|nr:DUF928 domain-containing protein [Leptolyngbya sp. FACHB-671]MBD2067721.1 DUF928 domain-containing protein [Leptolyngbya sp. FACHB-671]